MKTVSLNIEKLFKARNVIDRLLSFPGVDRKRVYWLARNKEKLISAGKEWFDVILPKVQEKYMIDIPTTPFVPVHSYKNFKHELMENIMIAGLEMSEINAVFAKFEVEPEIKRGIPAEKNDAFQKELKALADEYIKEVEIYEIVTDRVLDQVLSKLTGDEILGIEFMLEEASPIKIFPEGMIQ